MTTNTDIAIIVRLKLSNEAGVLNAVTAAISDVGANVGAIDLIHVEKTKLIRDFTIYTHGQEHTDRLIQKLAELEHVDVIHISDRTFLLHLGGKIEIKCKVPVKHRDELSMVYTPGVARVCEAIEKNPELAYNLTMKRNMVAVVTDGTAVLGLGDIGPLAGMPVMEGKAMLFKTFANVDAFPICLATKDVDEIVNIVKNISPGFGGINLEDIAAPRCFAIEERLKKELDIPVFHDDQHGTAIVLTAAFINALRIVKKKPEQLKVVISGVGAAGVACTHMLINLGVKNIIGCDRKSALETSRSDLDEVKYHYAQMTNPNNEKGTLKEVLVGADVFIGLSAPGLLVKEDIKNMNENPIVFAMANPTPEIMPEEAEPYVKIMATGRSDFPNQINNLLAFPGVFRGALDCLATEINEPMKLAAAHAIAGVIDDSQLCADYIVPSVFDKHVTKAVANAVIDAAKESGVARK